MTCMTRCNRCEAGICEQQMGHRDEHICHACMDLAGICPMSGWRDVPAVKEPTQEVDAHNTCGQVRHIPIFERFCLMGCPACETGLCLHSCAHLSAHLCDTCGYSSETDRCGPWTPALVQHTFDRDQNLVKDLETLLLQAEDVPNTLVLCWAK